MSSSDLFDEDGDELLMNVVEGASQMTEAQKTRAEKNRLKAIALKKSRLARTTPYSDASGAEKKKDFLTGDEVQKTKETKLKDTNAGFFIEEEEGGDDDDFDQIAKEIPAPVVEPDRPKCLDCSEELADSYLFRTFDHEVCDKCRDTEKDGKHELITKTDAKNNFLMKDIDFDREPALKFILRKNPHNPRWGDMKLFLRLQVEKRALEIWGTEEALEEEHEKREDKRDQAKVKKFNKKLKALRMQVRGSLYKRDISTHEHEYGEEEYDEDEDEYSRKCKTCDHVHKYEKM